MVGAIAGAEDRDVAVRLRGVASVHLELGGERDQGRAIDHRREARGDRVPVDVVREDGEGRAGAPEGVAPVGVAEEGREVPLVEVGGDEATRGEGERVRLVGDGRLHGGAEVARLVAAGERARLTNFGPARRGGGDDVDRGRRDDVDEVGAVDRPARDGVLDVAGDVRGEDGDVIGVGVAGDLGRHARDQRAAVGPRRAGGNEGDRRGAEEGGPHLRRQLHPQPLSAKSPPPVAPS